MEEDSELRLIEQRKMAQMKKRMMEASTQKEEKAQKTDREVVESMLYDRGDEVLATAYANFPRETEQIVKELAGMVRSSKFNERVSGGELYSIFRQVGLRFSLRTSIKVQDKGKLVDLSEKLGRGKDAIEK